MAAPNIVNVTTITGKTVMSNPSTNTVTVLLANEASSNKVYKINMIVASNADAANTVNTTIGINTTAAGNGNTFTLAANIAVPGSASFIAVDKSTAFYLEENESIVVRSNTASRIDYTVSYEEIS
jgi:hypothetical protein